MEQQLSNMSENNNENIKKELNKNKQTLLENNSMQGIRSRSSSYNMTTPKANMNLVNMNSGIKSQSISQQQL